MTLRHVSWIAAARREFDNFPLAVREDFAGAIYMLQCGEWPDDAKPLHGLDGGVYEIPCRYRGDSWRLVYALKIGESLWIVHAFQKKSKTGIATPKSEIETIRQRISRIRQTMRKST